MSSLGKILIIDQAQNLQQVIYDLQQTHNYIINFIGHDGQSPLEINIKDYKVVLIYDDFDTSSNCSNWIKETKYSLPETQIILVTPHVDRSFENIDEYIYSVFVVPFQKSALIDTVRRASKQNSPRVNFILQEAVELVNGTTGNGYAYVSESNRFVWFGHFSKGQPSQTSGIKRTIRDTEFTKSEKRFRIIDSINKDFSSILRVSLVQDHRLVGILDIERTNGASFVKEDALFLIRFADQVVHRLELENEFVIAIEREQIEILNRIHSYISELADSLELRDILDKAPLLMLYALGIDMASEENDNYISYIARRRENKLYGIAAYPHKFLTSEALSFLTSDNVESPDSLTAYVVQKGTPINEGNVNKSKYPYRQVFEWVNSQLSIPLIYKKDIIGVISVETSKLGAFTDQQVKHAELISKFIAAAIKRAEILDQEERAAKTLRNASELTSLDDMDEIFRIAVELARELIRWRVEDGRKSQYKSYLAVKEGDSLYFNPLHNPKDVQPIIDSDLKKSNSRIDITKHPKGISGRAVITGVSQLVYDVNEDDDYIQFGDHPGSQISVPIKVDEDIIAVINIEHPDAYVLDIQDQQTLEALVNLVEIVIKNTRQSATIDALNKANEQIFKKRGNHNHDVIQETMQIFSDYALIVLGLQNPKGDSSSFSHIAIVDSDILTLVATSPRNILQKFQDRGYETIDLKNPDKGLGIIGEAARDNKTLNIGNVATNDVAYINIDSQIKSQLSIPIAFENEVLGVLTIERDQLGEFDSASVKSIELLANQAAIIIKSELEGEKRKALSLGIPHTAFTHLIDMDNQINIALAKINDPSELTEILHRMHRNLKMHYLWERMWESLIGAALTNTEFRQFSGKELLDLLIECSELLQDKATQIGLEKIEVNRADFANFPVLILDADYFTLMIYNLLDNALKYSAKNPHVKMRGIWIKGQINGTLAEIDITNYGIPLRKEELSHIFGLSERGEIAKEVAHGNGMGLSMVKQIANLHDGFISPIASPEPYSEYDNPVTFKVSLRIPGKHS